MPFFLIPHQIVYRGSTAAQAPGEGGTGAGVAAGPGAAPAAEGRGVGGIEGKGAGPPSPVTLVTPLSHNSVLEVKMSRSHAK